MRFDLEFFFGNIKGINKNVKEKLLNCFLIIKWWIINWSVYVNEVNN